MKRDYYELPKTGWAMRQLWKCAGGDRYLLERATYSDQIKYMCLGGIVFATAKGSKTRKRILKKGKGYADDVKNKFDQLASDFTQKYESVLEEAKELVSNVDTK